MKVNRVLSLLILTFAFSCSTFYDATGKGRLNVQKRRFSYRMRFTRSSSILTLPLLTIAAGLPAPKVEDVISSSLYDKSEVKRCASSISSSILLTESIDSGLIAARARKLKKLRETDFCSRELDFFLLIDATNLLNRTTLTEFRNVF